MRPVRALRTILQARSLPVLLMMLSLIQVPSSVSLASGDTDLSKYRLPMAWTDDATGYAIAGYDPVDYFVLKKAAKPNPGKEAYWGGVSWKFRNSGNRQAFLAHPRTYVPRFGGADPLMLAKGRAVLGNPTLFDIYEDRLYLFYDGVNLVNWRAARAALLEKALFKWPRLAIEIGIDAAEPVNPPHWRPSPETAAQ